MDLLNKAVICKELFNKGVIIEFELLSEGNLFIRWC
jgi:hypothetical protein